MILGEWMLKNETKQYRQRCEKMANETGSREYAHKYRNWKDWLVYEACRDEVYCLKKGYRNEREDTPHPLSTAERTRIHFELFSFMEFVYRSWTDKNANAWVGSTYHRASEAFAARLLFHLHKKGIRKQRLRPTPPQFEENVKTFCKVFGIAL